MALAGVAPSAVRLPVPVNDAAFSLDDKLDGLGMSMHLMGFDLDGPDVAQGFPLGLLSPNDTQQLGASRDKSQYIGSLQAGPLANSFGLGDSGDPNTLTKAISASNDGFQCSDGFGQAKDGGDTQSQSQGNDMFEINSNSFSGAAALRKLDVAVSHTNSKHQCSISTCTRTSSRRY
jgi:hypothetical protein